MNSSRLERAQVFDALGEPPLPPRVQLFRDAFEHHSADQEINPSEPASMLLRALEPRYRHAQERGLAVEGAQELLNALSELGEALVTGVSVTDEHIHVVLYLTVSPLAPIDVVIVRR